ncbi:hypothetical protein [Phenylobacterium sp.]|uniref:hypothetical protein n=1 Tax=Phenylobacterium sp. TaxID=1871053 RepID=UPI0027315A68|nr:hypothetical protein [Phenylobacterium sp.]MDP1616120.1 hypothetical protein [Phenylobacterium sp.]MDP1988076.1 hypothetical protein [Phenylobacterium sp.]
MSDKDRPADPPREPGSDADQRRRDLENNPALSPVGPQGGAAIAPLRRKAEDKGD